MALRNMILHSQIELLFQVDEKKITKKYNLTQ